MKKDRSVSRRLRLIVQILFFVLVAATVTVHGLEGQNVSVPFLQGVSLHAICPFGGVVTLYQLFTTGTFVQKIHESSVWLLGLVLLTAVIAGPVFCGWACPFGSFQEWLGAIGRKLFKIRYNRMVPYKIDRILRYLRYVVLVWVVVVTAVSAKLVFSDFDPYFALFNFWTGEVAVTGFITLGIVVLLSLAIERPFCKYACPYGALLGLTNLFRIFGLRRNEKTCIDCKACDRSCPMNIRVSAVSVVRDHQCIGCLKCTSESACPVSHTVELNTRRLEADLREAAE